MKSGPVDGETLEALRLREEDLWIAETRFDNELMDRRFAPDFFEFGRSGRVYAREEMMFQPGQFDTIDATLPLADFSARWLSDDVVQVTYVSEVRYDTEILRGRRSSLWSLLNGRWRLRFHQGTPIPDE